jgi:peptidoglycan hydrolase-like protein with peptidoglycan-binding domain
MALSGILKVGSRGENVILLQQALKIPADGIFGAQTKNAVIAFQKEKGLKADGIVGPQTWDSLGLNKPSDVTISTAFLNDPEKTKVTATYSKDSSGYPIIGAIATKTINGNQQTFENPGQALIANDPQFVEGRTSVAFMELASIIAANVSPTTTYAIQNFTFVMPEGLEIPDPTEAFGEIQDTRDQAAAQADQVEAQASQLKVEAEQVLNSLSDKFLPKGSNKLPFIISKYGTQIATLILPPLYSLLEELIRNKFDELCPPEPVMLSLIERRNRIVNTLNTIGNIITVTGQTITGINNFFNISLATIKTLDVASIATSLAVKFIPSPPGTPGVITSTLNDLQTAIRKLTFDTEGNSKLEKIQGTIVATSLALSIIGKLVKKAVDILKSLDVIFSKCLPNATLTPISPDLIAIADAQTQAEETFNQNTYQGFIIEIEEIPYSSTVNRRRAIGKNQSGIVLIQTELSFTSDPGTLINELKLIIDRDNLKAY